jgi:hypothetical protein
MAYFLALLGKAVKLETVVSAVQVDLALEILAHQVGQAVTVAKSPAVLLLEDDWLSLEDL